jgi:membrane dipeptidase
MVLAGAVLSCSTVRRPGPDDLEARARKLARRLLIADAHIDLPYRLNERMEDVSRRTDGGDFDYPRARAGGLDLAFMAVFVPPSLEGTDEAKELADRLIDMMEALEREHPDRFGIVTSARQARERFEEERLGLALGMENGAPILGRLEHLKHFHDRGIRYITLAHAEANHICDSSYDEERLWHGLSPFGREVVAEMNRLGIMIDISHVSDETFFQAVELTKAPLIDSHSGCRHFTPGWERNRSDDMIRRLAETGGVIQINFGSSFVDDVYRRADDAAREEIKAHLEANDIPRDSDEGRAYRDDHFARHPIRRAELSDVVDHIDHVVGLVGIDHVGFGSDFDGLGDSLPVGLEDVSAYPNLIRELLKRGYSEEEIEKICSGNLLRVWSEVERVAARLQASPR